MVYCRRVWGLCSPCCAALCSWHATAGSLIFHPSEIPIASFNIRIFSNGSRDDGELELIADRLQQLLLI